MGWLRWWSRFGREALFWETLPTRLRLVVGFSMTLLPSGCLPSLTHDSDADRETSRYLTAISSPQGWEHQAAGGMEQDRNPVRSKRRSPDYRGQTRVFVQAHKDTTEIISSPLLVRLPWFCVLNRSWYLVYVSNKLSSESVFVFCVFGAVCPTHEIQTPHSHHTMPSAGQLIICILKAQPAPTCLNRSVGACSPHSALYVTTGLHYAASPCNTTRMQVAWHFDSFQGQFITEPVIIMTWTCNC